MARRENAQERAIRAAISELIGDGPFQISSITYPKRSSIAILSLNSSFDISVHLHARTSDAWVSLRPRHLPQSVHHEFSLSDVFYVLGLGPEKISENEGIIDKISEMIKLVKKNWSMIVSAFDNEDIINQLLDIDRKRDDAFREKTIREIRNALMEFTVDGTFRIAQLDLGAMDYVVLTLETDTNVSIGFIREKAVTTCKLIVEGITDCPGSEFWLWAVFRAIGVDTAILRFRRTVDIIDCIPIIMKAVKQHWPLIVQAFDDEHVSDTVHKINMIETKYSEEYEKQSQKLREYKNALQEFTVDGTYRFYFSLETNFNHDHDIGALDNITLFAETDTNVDILFVGDGKTVMCRLLVVEIPDDAENELPLSYVLQAIGIDPSIIMLPSGVDFVDGVFNIMKAIKQHWPSIIQAFDDKHRADTIRKIKIIKTNHEGTNKTSQ